MGTAKKIGAIRKIARIGTHIDFMKNCLRDQCVVITDEQTAQRTERWQDRNQRKTIFLPCDSIGRARKDQSVGSRRH